MSRIWTAPRSWKYKDTFSATQANQQLRDNLEYLKLKPRSYNDFYGLANDTPSISNSAWTAVNDLRWGVTIVTSEANEEVFVYLHGHLSIASGGQYVVLDVLMDNSIYLSTGTTTPSTAGLEFVYCATNSIAYPFMFRKRVVVPTAGSHTFLLRAKCVTTGVTVTFYTSTVDAFMGVQVE